MKRNKTSSRAMRNRHGATKPAEGTSRYARKKKAGNQMYGPGCCAHKIRLDYWPH